MRAGGAVVVLWAVAAAHGHGHGQGNSSRGEWPRRRAQAAAVDPKLVFMMEVGYREWAPAEDVRIQRAMKQATTSSSGANGKHMPTFRKLGRDLGRSFDAVRARWIVHGALRLEMGEAAAAHVKTTAAWCASTPSPHPECEAFLRRRRTCQSFLASAASSWTPGDWLYPLQESEQEEVDAMAQASFSTAAMHGLSAKLSAGEGEKGAIMQQRIAGLNLDAHISNTSALAFMQTHGGINSKPVNERTNSESVRCKLLSPVDASAPASCGVTGGSRACPPKYCDFHGSNVALTSVRFVFYGERNTGTRWFEGLLRGHFPYDMWRPAGGGWVPWKHGCVSFPPVPMRDEPIARHTLQAPPSTPAGVHQVILIKNPYAWLLSLFNRPYNSFATTGATFSEFLRTPLPAHDSEQENYLQCSQLRRTDWLQARGVAWQEEARARAWNASFKPKLTVHFPDSPDGRLPAHSTTFDAYVNPMEAYMLKMRSYIVAALDMEATFHPDEARRQEGGGKGGAGRALLLRGVKHTHFVRYEDLVRHPGAVLGWLRKRTCAPWTKCTNEEMDERPCAEAATISAKAFEGSRANPNQGDGFTLSDYTQFYGGSSWASVYRERPDDLDFVNAHLDAEVMRIFGYELL